MATKSITIPVSSSGFSVAAAWLDGYAERLTKKAEELVSAMLEEGENYAMNYLGHVDTGLTLSTLMSYREGDSGLLLVNGNAIWLEFGTGTAYNSAPHPMAAELGMSAHGTYVWPLQLSEPKRPHGGADGWYYPADEGGYKHTYGIPQNRFMYNTAQMLRKEYRRIAQEVFA